MIPWRLTFSGIRDYPPTLLDLSGYNEHVLITGPNGAGKSTLTFCMGAVLYSSKVDIEGLKSRNLPVDKTWYAKISLLFKNNGKMKIDAPAFIEFSLKIVQELGQPIKKEYTISSGETFEEWEETIRYTSGDRMNNFTAYKKALQYKYKIDPDLFYLIWYQQEVNQFAKMAPEERFRVFSEMYEIDEVQRNWEESMQQVKETEETLRAAEINVKFKKQELGMKRQALELYLSNQKRLREGGSLFIQSLLQLEKYYKTEIESLENMIEQLEGDIQEAKDNLAEKRVEVEQKSEAIKETVAGLEQLNVSMRETQKNLEDVAQKIKEIQSRMDELDRELAEITKRKSQITRTEDEVKAALTQLAKEEEDTNALAEQNRINLEEKKNVSKNQLEKITRLEWEIQKDNENEAIHKERLKIYKSSHEVQSIIDSLEKRIKENKDAFYMANRQLEEWTEELKLLEENRDLSPRQLESIKFFRIKGINAYPFRELIELDDGARLKDEQLFDSIKYTIFFDGRHVSPPNDLYHVPLMKIIPDRSVERLPALRLRMKENLTEDMIPIAMKALWWVEQFFKDNPVKIQKGLLVDPVGYRGPQEKSRFILSEKALLERKQKLKKSMQELGAKLEKLNEQISKDTKKVQELNSIIQQVRESEAFMTSEHERVMRKEKLAKEKELKAELDNDIRYLEAEQNKLMRIQVEQENFREVLENEAKVYVELGKMKEKYEERNALYARFDELKSYQRTIKGKLNEFEEKFGQLELELNKLVREKRGLESEIEDAGRNISWLEKQKKSRFEEQEAMEIEIVDIIQELEEMKQVVPELYEEVSAQVDFKNLPSSAQLKQSRENGRTKFQNARSESGIDPNAPANYETVKQEYDRLENEYHRTKILLDQDKERMEDLKDKLETTINMRVTELNRLFQTYMSHFQFEGLVDWESYEDRKSRTHFKLYIKARKEGHRGKLEDVSTKARGGKVGKGVSGGEESLSSLLFALALLQNLQTSPGFIVLDEFDSALDEERKVKVFDLYEQELQRKMIILTPKSHEADYLDRFSKAFIVQHDPTVPRSKVVGIVKTSG